MTTDVFELASRFRSPEDLERFVESLEDDEQALEQRALKLSLQNLVATREN